MKRIVFTLFLLCSTWCVYADVDCESVFAEAQRYFKAANYEEAKIRFEWCRDFCNDSYARQMIAKCDELINGRRQAEAAAVKQRQAEAVKRANLRKEKKYIHLMVFTPEQGYFQNNISKSDIDVIKSDIQDKMKIAAPDLNFDDDPSMTYWEVRVMINYEKQAISDYHRFSMAVYVEIEDVLNGEVKRFPEREEGACLSDITETQAAKFVADEISSRGDLYCRIAERIVNSIKGIQISSCTQTDGNSLEKTGEKTVLLMSYEKEIPEEFVNELHEQMLKSLVNNSERRFKVLNRSSELKMLRNKEIRYEEGNVKANKVVPVIVGASPKYLCGIVIKGSEAHSISCSIIDLETEEFLPGMYATFDDPLGSLDKESAENVARDLSIQLKLWSKDQIRQDSIKAAKKARHDLDKKADADRKRKEAQTKSIMTAFVPFGVYQLYYKEKKTSGYLFMAGEAVCIGGAVYAQCMNRYYNKKYYSTHNTAYADKANKYIPARNVSLYVAAAVYIGNVVEALFDIKKHNKSFALNPVVTEDGCAALTLSINF